MYLLKLQNVVQIAKYICPDCKMYLCRQIVTVTEM